MNSKHVLGFMLATSFALTTLVGCNVPGAAPPSGAQVNNQGSPQAGAPTPGATRDGAAEALAEEREMGDLDAVALDDSAAAAYAVTAVGQPEPRAGDVAVTAAAGTGGPMKLSEHAFKGKLKPEVHANLKEHIRKRAAKAHERHKGHASKVSDAAKSAQWKDNGDGTESRTLTADVSKEVNGKALARKVEITHTRHIESKHLIESHIKLEAKLPNGASRTSERTKTLTGENGAFASSFLSTLTLKSGAARVATCNHVISAEGAVSGKAEIAWKNKAAVTMKSAASLAISGTEENAQIAVGSDAVDADAPEAADDGTDATDDDWGEDSDSDQGDN